MWKNIDESHYYKILDVANRLKSSKYSNIFGRMLYKIAAYLLMKSVGEEYEWKYEEIKIRYNTGHRELKWWFAVRHKRGEIHEEPVTRFFIDLLKPGDVVFDIGAAYGHYSLLAGKIVGDNGIVKSIDVNHTSLEQLRKSVALNDLSNMELILKYIDKEDNPKNNCITLDTLIAEKGILPDIIKMDIEGKEMDALIGGKSMFSTKNVDLICEVHPKFLESYGSADEEVFDTLLGYGFHIYHIPHIREVNVKTELFRITAPVRLQGDSIPLEYMIYATKNPDNVTVRKYVN